MKKENITLLDNLPLLNAMMSDLGKQKDIYKPGPYWEAMAEASCHEIRNKGIANFRGSSNLIGQSYSDSLVFDKRLNLRGPGMRSFLRWMVTEIFPFNKIFQAQVNCTADFSRLNLIHIEEILKIKKRSIYLFEKYKIPYSLLGGCAAKVNVDGADVAVHYINLLDQQDYVAQLIDFKKVKSVFEIGGGFGVNIHLLLENYKNIKKVLYLDIPPNLYVGTQYLKAFYGDAVVDYEHSRTRTSIQFDADDRLEIICIAPWQVELLNKEVDVFINSHSFVEMPYAVVQNYANKAVNDLCTKRTAIALTSYDEYDESTTINPNKLSGFFKNRDNFLSLEKETLLSSNRRNLFYVDPGDFGFS